MPLDGRNAENGKSFPLAMAGEGERLRIVSHAAPTGCQDKNLERRLTDLGLPVGSEIHVVNRHGPGRMVVGRGFSRIALGSGMAGRILVTPA